MVSFFGLKLGGDKKKSHDKHKPPSRSIQHLNDQTNDRLDSPREFPVLQRPTSNFSRPGRPDTSSSNHAPTQWNAPYIGGAGATSSMVNLAAPRAPGLGSSRMHASDLNLNTRFNGSSTSLAMPGPIGGANRPGTPTRPGTATSKKADWENPFHVNFGGADSVGNTPISPVAGKNSLEQFEFGVSANHTRDTSNQGINGYPSPPPSILSAEQPFSPKNSDGRPSSSRRNAPSALRNVETTGPRALPSPAASVLRTSEDVWDVPVIRNVQAKRDTLTFHTPRRQSFSMEVDDVDKVKGKPMTEGLAGNFTAFDFGEKVRRGSASKNSLEAPSIDSISPTGGVGPRPFGTARTASPLRSMQSTPSLSNESRSTRERNTSDAASALSSTQESIGRRSPIPPARPIQPVQLQQADIFRMQPPAPAPTGPIPAPPKGTSIRTNNAAPAAAYGVHPGYMSRPLDPPPRGFRARVDSDSRRRPPNGLRVPPPLVDRSGGGSISSLNSSAGNPRSPYGPPPDEGSYMSDDRLPRPPPEDRAHSPFARPVMEGNFPVQKGLPRGRRPPALEGLSPEPGGLGPRRQQRQRPMYPPPKAEPSPTSDSKPKNSTEDHGYSLPNWNDFDRASPHRSAMIAPLSPFRTDSRLPETPPADDNSRQSMYTSSPISPKPPSLPSPSFFSLQSSISNSSENLARTFDVASENTTTNTNATNEYGNYPRNRPLISPVTVEFSRSLSPGNTRVEARKAPPRPSPITLAPSNDTERDRSRTPTAAVDQFSPGFI
ncbi:hypothetical protein B0J13DRAFT_147764 [Dactylonectria estremocensis]|uniref:Uncharacterized protein n=1 Tax=Dactylonectria estremocensis TaxID=1079267 RepID=A0A9P9DWJ0_9HYPO|nr:hypothetical protein B0J13DRAFT_147764 [Dactylonectria estremocensis]